MCLDVSKESEERCFCFWTIKTITFPGYSQDLYTEKCANVVYEEWAHPEQG